MSEWAKAAKRTDGWINAITGIGMTGRDKSKGTTFCVDALARETLEALWRGDDMAARVIETIPNEMLREGFELHSGDKDTDEKVMASLEDLDVSDAFVQALCLDRAFGGSGILIGANDGQLDLTQPLHEDAIKSIDWLTVLSGGPGGELRPNLYYDDPRAKKFGEPMTYCVQADATTVATEHMEVHESRLILFKGVRTTRRQTRINQGWGDSVLIRCNKVLSDFHQSWGSAAILLQDFSQAVLSIKDLADLIATNQDDVIVKRAQAIDLCRSVARMVLLDAEESFERKATPMTGLPEMLQQFALRFSAAADMPVSLLMGQAPAGLNATGASDIRFFYDRTKSRQTTRLFKPLQRLVRLLLRAKSGPTAGQEPDAWTIKFKPLWQLTELEQADVKLKQAQVDQIEIMAGVVTAEEVAISRHGGDSYSTTTTIDMEGRKEMKKPPTPEAEEKARAPFQKPGAPV